MTSNNFIKRRFKSEEILLTIEYSKKLSITTFINYLEKIIETKGM